MKIFLLEFKKNFLSFTFLLSVIALAADYITQCQPGEFRYLSEPKTREQFIYETLQADAERGATEEITGFIFENGGYEKETIYEKIPLTDDVLNFMERMLERLKQGQQFCGYDTLDGELHELSVMTGGNNYYEPFSINGLYENYLIQGFGEVSIENAGELCLEMAEYLEKSIEQGAYKAYEQDASEYMEAYSETGLKTAKETAQEIEQILAADADGEEKYKKIQTCFNKLNSVLGKDSVFSVLYRDRQFQKVYSLEGAKEQYKSLMEDEKLTNAYARYYADYMTLLAGLLPAVFGAFCLYKDARYKMQDMVFSKKISSFWYVFMKFLGIAALFFVAYMVIAGVSTLLFSWFANKERIAIDYFAFFKYAIFWIMPTVYVTTASSMFLYTFFWTPLPALLVQVMISYFSLDFWGYQLWRPIIRFNTLGSYDIYKSHLGEIVLNRVFMTSLSLLLLFFCAICYEKRRKGMHPIYNAVQGMVENILQRKSQ